MLQQRFANMTTQIPDDIARLAHEQQLGTPQASYMIVRLARGWRWSLFLTPFSLIILVSAFAMIFIASHLFPDDSFALSFFMTWMATTGFAFIALSFTMNFTQKISTLYPCDKGFILNQSTNKFRVIRWSEIETVWYTFARLPTRLYIKSRLYTIHCHDGETFTFNDAYNMRGNTGYLHSMLEEYFIRRRLPFQFADFQAGLTLHFGPLNINREGIAVGDKALAWGQMAGISLLKDRRLVVYKAGEQPEIWLNLPAFKIPNLGILLALFKRLHNGQSEQEAGLEALTAYGTAATIVQGRGKIDALPEGLAALAEEHKLGERRLDQKLGRSRLISWAALSTLLILNALLVTGVAIGIKSLFFPFTPGDDSLISFISLECRIFALAFLMFIFLATRSIIRSLQQIHTSTYTFERGIIFKRGQQAPAILRWEDIAVVRRTYGYPYQRQQSALPLAFYAHTLQLHDGVNYTLTRLNIKQETLSKIIKEQVVPLQLPAAIAAFQEKQTLTFGKIQINTQGIAVGKRLLPLSQIKSVSLQGQQLMIYDITQRKPWCKLLANSVPNLFLLFALVDYARETGRERNEFL